MSRVKVTDLRPGQTVAQDVTDARRNVLVRAGTALTADLIQKLVQRGISVVSLAEGDGSSATVSAAAPPAELDRLFEGTTGNPLMAALLDAVKRFRAENAG